MMPKVDFDKLAQFKFAIISLIGQDGFPLSLPTEFRITSGKEILLKKPVSAIPVTRRTVGVLFNHIAAVPTGGYTDRRYVLVWGNLSEKGDMLRLQPESISEWDEKILPFPELCAKSAPQGQRYLENLRHQIAA